MNKKQNKQDWEKLQELLGQHQLVSGTGILHLLTKGNEKQSSENLVEMNKLKKKIWKWHKKQLTKAREEAVEEYRAYLGKLNPNYTTDLYKWTFNKFKKKNEK